MSPALAVDEPPTQPSFDHLRYISMADNVPGVVYQMVRYPDGSRKVPYISAAVEDVFGVTREDVYANANILIDTIHPEDREEKERQAGHSMTTLRKFDWAGRIVRPDGEVRWIHALSVPSRLADGGIHWDGVMLDVTREKKGELEHLEIRERLAWLLKSSPVVIYACSAESPFPLTYLSDNAAELLGVDLDEYRSDPFYWQNRIHPDDADANIAVLNDLEVSRHRIIEYRFRASRDEYRWVRDEMLLVSRDGRTEIVGTVVDVTERKVAQEALRESEERFRAMTGASPVGVFVTDKTGALVYGNAKLAEILRIDQEALLGRRMYELLHGEDSERVVERIEEALAREKEASVQCRFSLGDYTTIWCSIKTAPLIGAGSVGTVEDMTERHEFELQTEQARIEAERANQAKSAFLSRLSHELRTPLHAVLGFAQLLQVSHLTEQQEESVEQIVAGGRHMLSLINDVLDIARAESGDLRVECEPVVLAPLVSEAVRMLSIQAREKNVLIDVKLKPDDQTTVLADRKRLLQVAINVISNAIKYNKREGAIIVSLEKAGDERVTLIVRDTGTGIAQEKVGRLFTPFDRLGAEGTEVEGSGLGLILSKRLVEAMRGSIRIESDVRTGTTARVTLMLEPSRAFAAVQMGEQESIERGRFNVLLIEDDAAVLSQLESTTSRLGGCRTIVARSASRGLDVALETLPEVVIVDADLPDVGGADFLKKVWKVPELRKTKFIVIGSKREELETFRSAGARSFLCKPLDCDQLAASVDALKERAGL